MGEGGQNLKTVRDVLCEWPLPIGTGTPTPVNVALRVKVKM